MQDSTSTRDPSRTPPDIEIARLGAHWFVQMVGAPDALCIHRATDQALSCARRVARARGVDLRVSDGGSASAVLEQYRETASR